MADRTTNLTADAMRTCRACSGTGATQTDGTCRYCAGLGQLADIKAQQTERAKLIDDCTNDVLDAYRSLRMSIENGETRAALESQARDIVDLERNLTRAILG